MQRSFAMGEIGPSLYGGAEQPRYQAALAACRNFLVQRHGGVANRPGTMFIAEVKDSTARTYLFKFVYSDTDTYVLEAGNQYFRFFRNGGQVVVSGVAAWSNLTTYVIGDLVVQGGVNYYCILGHTNHIPPNATYWYPLTGTILEIPTPYAAVDLPLLKYDQSADIITFTHTGYPIYELRRYQSRWTMTPFSTAPWASAPTNLVANAGTAGTLNPKYVVTAAKAGSYEETLASAPATCANSAVPTNAVPNPLTWDAVAGSAEYHVYVDQDGNGLYGFIGVALSNSFRDIGFVPDASVTPPVAQTVFGGAGDYPGTPAHYQQRALFGGSTNNPQTVNASRTGAFHNYTISSPIQDDDAIAFGIAGRRVNAVRHLIDIGKLIALTSTGEFAVQGDVDGVLRPTAINLKQQTYYGAADIVPVIVGSSILYVQARGGQIRDFQYQGSAKDSYDGRDLTLYAPHLFEGRIIQGMDFALLPQSIVWVVRDDGVLLGLTYIKDQDVWGWHRHDTVGLFEAVACVPETTLPPAGSALRGFQQDSAYVIVNRTIQGVTKRYVETFAPRAFGDYRLDAYFMDASLTYNGINIGATTMMLTTGGGWTVSDLLTITASGATFDGSWVGLGVTIWIPGVKTIRVTITAFVDATHVQGNPSDIVPVGLRNTATTAWSKAVANVSGLSHLEGQVVTALANGVVIPGAVVGGSFPLNGLYDVVHVGLPITAEIETLDLDSDQQPIRDARKLIRNVSLVVSQSRGGFLIGPDRNNLIKYTEDPTDLLGVDVFSQTGANLLTKTIEENITATWDKPGRVVIRQTDPLPLSILGIILNGPVGG